MNQAHFHLLMNHLPIIIPFIGLLVLVTGLFLRSSIVQRVAFGIFILGALFTIPAFISGDGAEEVVEKIQGIDENTIKIHEEAAEVFAILSYVLGAVAAIALWANWKKKAFARMLAYAVIVASLAVLFYAKQTGTTGGEIRHTEIRSNAAISGSANEKEEEEEEK